MKRFWGALAGVAVCIPAANAEIRISWNSPGSTFFLPGGVPWPNSSLFLAFWSPDATAGFDPANPTVPVGGDIFLGARNSHPIGGTSVARITGYGGGDELNESTYGLPPDTLQSGYVYIAVINMPFASYTGPSSIVPGTLYTLAPGIPVAPQGGLSDAWPPSGPPPPPDVVDYRGLTYVLSSSIIPEPGTAVLGLFGLAAVGWARRRRLANLKD